MLRDRDAREDGDEDEVLLLLLLLLLRVNRESKIAEYEQCGGAAGLRNAHGHGWSSGVLDAKMRVVAAGAMAVFDCWVIGMVDGRDLLRDH